nr:hypothetical protein [Tanacetum cinerariifolium]
MLPYTSWALPRSGIHRNNKRELAHEVVIGWKLVYQVDRLCCSVGDSSSICCCYVAVGDQLAQLLEEKPMTMATTIEQQVALDEALVPSAQRLRIGHNVPEICMQKFWATATVHQHCIRFKMDTRKHIVDLEAFREMLHISPRVLGQSFAELPFKEEILEFLRLSNVELSSLRNTYKVNYIVCVNSLWNKNMATTIEQQTALDESLVPSSQRLRIGRSNFRFPSDIQSKEATLQVEFWATAKLHHNYIHFKIDTRKSVLDLEAFREMLHISQRIPNQPFADLPTEEEILDFLRFLGHNHDIRYLTDVNVNKLYQPWRSFAFVINKCLTGKSSIVDSFRLSQAQMLWGF